MSVRIVFQGDSITDAGRSREYDQHMGSGYPTLTAAKLAYEMPGKYECLNRGISGNRIVDLYARWRIDAVNLKPDILSILIGVNDVWHDVGGRLNGVEADRFEKVYDMLLDYTREQLPQTKIIVLEPFILRSSATEEYWDYFAREVPLRAAAAKRAAERHGTAFIPLQEDLDRLCGIAPAECWLRDGVHPNHGGHELIARKLVETIKAL